MKVYLEYIIEILRDSNTACGFEIGMYIKENKNSKTLVLEIHR